MREYSIEDYITDIDDLGLELVWGAILSDVTDPNYRNGVLSVSNFGELYEIGLEHINKVDKKIHGKYFTPHDVSRLMGEWLLPLPGENVCDVCCGLGNLILAYLELLGRDKARELLLAGKVWLYDSDRLALSICKHTIGIIYGEDCLEHIHAVEGDFLSESIKLPENAKVISNPPYSIVNGQELYSAIMEKILDSGNPFVTITPYSFLGGNKFSGLREKLNSHSGFIVTFDNTPGQIFNGRKKGIFNSNCQNQVRPSITVCQDSLGNGFRMSNLIRFKNSDRDRLLSATGLEPFIGSIHQKITKDSPKFAKCAPELESIYEVLYKKPIGETLSSHLVKDSEFKICFPNTCRYFTVASLKELDRDGKYTLCFKDAETRDLAYAWLNSSFCHWHWRLYDGGIVYQKSLLGDMPMPLSKIDDSTKELLLKISGEMQSKESEFLVYKKNRGVMQENIKFPVDYRLAIDGLILSNVLKIDGLDGNIFNIIHDNSPFTPLTSEQ